MKKSFIPYTSGPSINPIVGCTEYSRGCTHCWARAWSRRFRKGKFDLQYFPEKLDIIRRKKSGLWFVGSMTDLFQDGIEVQRVANILDAITHSKAKFLFLTKRAFNMQSFFYALGNPPDNLGIGVTAEGQAEWDERVPILLSIKAKMRFVSIEPILEPVNIALTRPSPDWIQCGPETGTKKRPYDPKWIELICRDCRKMGIRFFDKQNPCLYSREWPEGWKP